MAVAPSIFARSPIILQPIEPCFESNRTCHPDPGRGVKHQFREYGGCRGLALNARSPLRDLARWTTRPQGSLIEGFTFRIPASSGLIQSGAVSGAEQNILLLCIDGDWSAPERSVASTLRMFCTRLPLQSLILPISERMALGPGASRRRPKAPCSRSFNNSSLIRIFWR